MTSVFELFLTLDGLSIIFVAGIVTFAAMLRAFTGFGFALCAVPVFSLFLVPHQAATLSTLMAFFLNLGSFPSYKNDVKLKPLLPIFIAILIGTAVGTVILSSISKTYFQFYVGISVIFACILIKIRSTKTRGPATSQKPIYAPLTGLASGLMNGTLAIPGPPVIIYAMLTEPNPSKSRAFLMAIFLGSSGLATLSFAIAGFIDRDLLIYFAVALPCLIIGNQLGTYFFKRHGNDLYNRVALISLACIGFAITVKSLM